MSTFGKFIDRIWAAQNQSQQADEAVQQKQHQITAPKPQKAPATKPVQTAQSTDTRTTAQKAADSKAAYTAYQGSEEQKKNRGEANKKALQEVMDRLFAVPNTSMGEMPLQVAAPVPVDQKEQELKAEADYYEGRLKMEQDQAMMEADLAEYESWSAQDKANMEQYLEERNRHQNNIFGAPQFDTYNLNPLFQTKDPAKVRQMAESIQRSRNAQTMEQATAAADQLAQEHPVLGSAASVATNLASSYTGPVEIAKEMANRTGRYQTMDPNNLGGIGQQFGGTVRQNVSQQIEGENGNWLRKLAAVGYEGVMSAADSTARMAAGGFNPGVSAAIAASGGFSNSLRQYSAQGATPEQAAAAALATAGIEYITEKIPMDELLKVGKGGWKNVLKQAFLTEPTTEEISLFAGVAAETLILGKNSDRSQKIGELVANGMSYQEATEQLDKQLWMEAARTYGVSAVAGGMSGAGAKNVYDIQAAMDELGAELAKNMPAEQPVQLTEGQRAMQQAADEVVGVKPVEQTAAEVAGADRALQNAIDEALGLKRSVDANTGSNYNNTINTGGTEYDRGTGTGDSAEGMAGVQLRNRYETEGRREHGGVARNSGVLRLSKDLENARASRGVQGYELYDTSESPQQFEQALIEGRNSDPRNGWCVTPKSAKELKDGNYRTFMNENGTVGLGVAPDGDIVAVFKNKNGGPRRAMDTAMPAAIEMGGDRLDCYGSGLVTVYEDYGFVPVARVEFNPEYANDGWTPDKGTPYIYFMMHNGDSAADVTARMHTYQHTDKAALDSLPTFGKDDYDAAMEYRDNLIEQRNGAGIKGTGAAEQNKSVGGMASQFEHDVKRSKIYDNTYANSPNADVRLIGREAERQDPNIGQYDVITEKESLHEAELRTETGRDRYSEYRYLIGKDGWTGADNDTASRLLDIYRREKKTEMFTALAKKQREMGTQAGQMIQSFAKYSRANATDAAADAILDLDKLTIDQIDTTFWNPKNEAKSAPEKKNALQKWKESVSTSLLEVADDIDHVADGDSDAMRAIVRQIANLRHTTAMAGYSSELTKRTERGLAKMDFETLKTVAKTQLSMIPNDFRKRSTGEIVKQIRMQNMLFTLTTKFKNDTGNISNGIMDSVSDSFGGRAMDVILSKYTGKRTVANDTRYAPEYLKAARDAADVAAAFVSLDIPMETDAKYAAGRTRTWSPNTTSTLGRLMSAYEKHMKYALEVSDKFYEGGTSHIVSKSLESLGEKSGLTAEEIKSLAEKTGARRTFKDPGVTTIGKDGRPKSGRVGARVASGIQRGLNEMGTENIGAGDLLIPFAKVAAEVKQVGIDYTGSGMITGMSEMIGIIKDAKAGKEIDPYRQRKAATDFGRGMTGVALTALFTAMASVGTIKVHNDKDKEERTMDQAQGLSGAQWNLGSAIRWMEAVAKGATEEEALEAAKWKHGDELTTVDFLEPFNTQMHIGYLISQGESIPKAVLKGNLEALLEMPMMQTFSDLADITQAFTEISEGDMGAVLDATGQLVGTVAGAAIPNFARKAAQVIDPYFRDTYDTNPLKKAGKELVAGIPGASMLLPKKYDNLGQEQRRYEEGEGFAETIDALITPWDTKTYQTNPVYQEVERLNAALAGTELNVTPPQPKRKISYTDNTGKKHKDYAMTAEEYETVAKTQGQTAAKLLDQLIASPDYKSLSDEQKAYAIKAVYEYAAEKGKQEALPDYFSEADTWVKNARDNDIGAFISQGTIGPLKTAVNNVVKDLSNGWKVTPAAKQEMDETYDGYSKLSPEAKQRLQEQLDGDVKKFLEVRQAGVSTNGYLKAVEAVKALKPEGEHKDVVPGQRWEAALEGGTTSEAKDALVKAYMDDYNPESSAPDKTELKYDYLRQELNRSPAEAIAIMRAKQEGGGKDAVTARWSGLGYSPAECKILWNLLGTTGSEAIDVVGWHNSKTK